MMVILFTAFTGGTISSGELAAPLFEGGGGVC